MIRLVSTGLSTIALLCAATASAQERCVATQYRLPPSIADEMRPYLICGLMDRQTGDPGTVVNGVFVSMGRLGYDTSHCAQVRDRAFAAADQRLSSTVRNPASRRSFLESEFKKADEFLKVATRLGDLGIGEEPNAPPCKVTNAQH